MWPRSWLQGLTLLLFLAHFTYAQSDFPDEDDGIKAHWAVLIAGSNGWWNYRHQADVLHSYQVLRRGGLHPSRIVLMVYDDLAMSSNNPTPGRIINSPGGRDVYGGAVIDYRGDDVNAEVFLNVLEGNEKAVRGVGSGKVVKSGPHDRVFVFYSDHGSPGVLGMPTGPFLYADQLMASLKRKHEASGYREMVLYIEACESGSMFEGLLGPEISVYATTAANAMESSWGTYCPGMEPGPPEGFDTCLGDLYSVSWMEDAEQEDMTEETLGAQYDFLVQRTSNNFTYNMGSHVMQYGDLGLQSQVVGGYIGMKNRGNKLRPLGPSQDVSPSVAVSRRLLKGGRHASTQQQQQQQARDLHLSQHLKHRVKQRDADLVPLRVAAARAGSQAEKEAAQAKLDHEVQRRQSIDLAMETAAARLVQQHQAVAQAVTAALGGAGKHVRMSDGSAGTHHIGLSTPLWVELLTGHMGRPGKGKPLVDDWECLRSMVGAYEHACGRMDQYAMRHTRFFANLCNAGVQSGVLGAALAGTEHCSLV